MTPKEKFFLKGILNALNDRIHDLMEQVETNPDKNRIKTMKEQVESMIENMIPSDEKPYESDD